MDQQTSKGISLAVGIASITFGVLCLILSFVPCVGAYAMYYAIFPLILGMVGYFLTKKFQLPLGLSIAGIIIALFAFIIGSVKMFWLYNVFGFAYSEYGFNNYFRGGGGWIVLVDVVVIIGVTAFVLIVNNAFKGNSMQSVYANQSVYPPQINSSNAGYNPSLNRSSAKFTIGRVAGCDIIINDPTVSKMHAEILIENSNLLVRDLGSTNGTFINSRRISGTQILRPNDILKVGNSLVPWRNYVNL